MSEVKYLIQGLNEDKNNQDLLIDFLNKQYKEVYIYSAFLRSESVEDVQEILIKQKGKVVALIGIRNGATTKQGLEALYDAGVKIYVVDTGSVRQIFHPKTYVGINSDSAEVIIGSANFTPGGLRGNIENCAILSLDFSNTADKQFINDFLQGYATIINDFGEQNVKELVSKDMIQEMFEEGRIIDEKVQYSINNVGTNNSNEAVVPRMKLKIKNKLKKTAKAKKAKPITNNRTTVVLSGEKPAKLTEIWKSKPLVERDLNVPSSGVANVTGSMLLKKGVYDIDQQTYFRNVAFKNLVWSKKEGKPDYFEYANAKFYFVIDGIEYTPYELTVKFDTRTDTTTYKQKQPMTHLIWGKAKELVRNEDLLGRTMILYSIDGKTDEFVIEIKEIEDTE